MVPGEANISLYLIDYEKKMKTGQRYSQSAARSNPAFRVFSYLRLSIS
jgi:hypothetical protein